MSPPHTSRSKLRGYGFCRKILNLYFQNSQLMVTCAAEAENPEVSKEYHLLRRMIDVDSQFIEVTALGEELAMQVIK